MTSIVKDPEVAALGRRVMATNGHRHVFHDGYAPGPTLDSHWYVNWDAKSLADAFVHIIVSFWEPEHCLPSAEIVAAASAALADRIAALRALLSTGRVGALGTNRTSGLLNPIHRVQWLRAEQAIDARRGDLCERGSSELIATWTGIVLECPHGTPASSAVLRFQQMIEWPKIHAAPVSSIATETGCTEWLLQLVREHPELRPKSREELFREAKVKWPKLSGRGFDRAWASATAGARAAPWRSGGRPRKTPAPKTSAPK